MTLGIYLLFPLTVNFSYCCDETVINRKIARDWFRSRAINKVTVTYNNIVCHLCISPKIIFALRQVEISIP